MGVVSRRLRSKRGISEVVSVLLLLGVTALSFVVIMYVVPSYFGNYLRIGLDATLDMPLRGLSTDGHLKRVGKTLVVMVYNHGAEPVEISYTVFCKRTSDSTTVDIGKTVVRGGSLFTKVYQDAPSGICFLVVEEPNLITYKLVES